MVDKPTPRIEDIRNENSLSENERRLIYYIREIGYGMLEIKVHSSRPIMIIQKEKMIKLIDL